VNINGVVHQTVTATRVTVGRRLRGASVLVPVQNGAATPTGSSFTLYQLTPAAQWTFTNPVGHVPTVTVYMLSGVQADTDIDLDGNQIIITWANPHAGYVVIS
jgi:hypothetical protein